jgi:hypothetical protein
MVKGVFCGSVLYITEVSLMLNFRGLYLPLCLGFGLVVLTLFLCPVEGVHSLQITARLAMGVACASVGIAFSVFAESRFLLSVRIFNENVCEVVQRH